MYGDYTLLDKTNPDTYSYTRELNGKKFLIMLNFKGTPAATQTGLDLSQGKVVLGNYPQPSTDGRLKPYEAVVLEIP